MAGPTAASENTMKILAALSLAVLLTACQLTNQTIAYRSLASVETSTVAAFDSYLTAVAKGKVSTNAVPKISKDFQAFQDAMRTATLLVQGNTNAVAPANLTAQSATLLNEISTAK